MGRNYYIPDDAEQPFLVAAGGDIEQARELMIDTLENNPPPASGVDASA